MPPRTLLSAEQRTRLFAIPSDSAEMVRHYVLDGEDLALIQTKRRSINRLGFAVQLCLLRYPGLGMGAAEQPPEGMIAFVADQLAVPSAVFADYAQLDQTCREHAVELQRYLFLRSFGLADWRTCLRVGTDAAWATDRGEPIVQAMLAHLRANGVLLPVAAVLERIGLAARARARKKTFEMLAAGLSDSERDTLTGLLAVDPELRRSRFAWLRDYSESPAPSNIDALLDRLEHARGLRIDPARAGRIHADRLARLIDEGAIMSVQHIADLEPARRTAILVVQAASLETRLSDATLAMFEKYIGTLFSRARNRAEKRFQATRRDVARALILFRRTIAALRHAKEAGEDGVAVVEREIGMKQLDGVLPVIGAVADLADQDILVTAAERYSVLRRFSPRFLAAFDNLRCWRQFSPTAPISALPAWPMHGAASATSPRQRGAMAYQRRQLRLRPRCHRQHAPQATDGGHLGRRDNFVVGRTVFPGRRPCGRGRFRQCQIRHRPRRGTLHAGVRPLWTILHAGHFGDDERRWLIPLSQVRLYVADALG